MVKPIRIVLGDCNAERSAELRSTLLAHNFEPECCADGEELLDRCRADQPWAVIIDEDLPRVDGLEVLKQLKEDAATAAVRVIVVIHEDHPHTIQRARLLGADGVLMQPLDVNVLVKEINQVISGGLPAIPQGDSENNEAAALDVLLATMGDRAAQENPLLTHITDPLTGLFNQAYMNLKLAEEFKKSRRFSIPLTVITAGIDDDGRLFGPDADERLRNRVLNEVAGVVLCESRDIDQIGRADSDFLMLLPHTDTTGASAMADRILRTLAARELGTSEDHESSLTVSVGIAELSQPGTDTWETLVARSSEARHAAASWGGQQAAVWGENMQENASS